MNSESIACLKYNTMYYKFDNKYYAFKLPNEFTEVRVNGVLHNEDGPAIVWADGSEAWYLNGVLHSDFFATVKLSNGIDFRFNNGVLHHDTGPAISCADGTGNYYFYGDESFSERHHINRFMEHDRIKDMKKRDEIRKELDKRNRSIFDISKKLFFWQPTK